MRKRIQRKRTKNWKMPENAVYVGRPTKIGNPIKVSDDFIHTDNGELIAAPLEYALAFYRHWLDKKLKTDPLFLEELRGKDLACWCRLDELCHADIILESLYPAKIYDDISELRLINWLAKDDWKKKEFCYRLKDIYLTEFSTFGGYDLQEFTKPVRSYDEYAEWGDDEYYETGEIYSWHEHILERRKIGDAVFHRPTKEFRYRDINDHQKQSERFDHYQKLCRADKITDTMEVPKNFDKAEAVLALRRLIRKYKPVFRKHIPKPERPKYPFLKIRRWMSGDFDEFKVRVPGLACTGCGTKLLTDISFWDLLKIKQGIFESVRQIRCESSWINAYSDCAERIKDMRSEMRRELQKEKGWETEKRLVSLWAQKFFGKRMKEFETELELTERFEKHRDEFSR
jgi:hypothetical protein